MRSPAKSAVWLLPFMLSGCSFTLFHKPKPTPPLTLAPPILPARSLDIALVEIPIGQSVIAAKPIYNMPIESLPLKQAVKRHRLFGKPVEVPESAMNPATNSTPAVSAIGNLSSGDPASTRYQTEDTIATVERGLNGINRPLDDTEQKTAGQIREFLKQAKAALASGDTDGARTLTEKAKALLTELAK